MRYEGLERTQELQLQRVTASTHPTAIHNCFTHLRSVQTPHKFDPPVTRKAALT